MNGVHIMALFLESDSGVMPGTAATLNALVSSAEAHRKRSLLRFGDDSAT